MSHQGIAPERAFEQVIPQITSFIQEKGLFGHDEELRYRKQGDLYILKVYNKRWLTETRIAQWKLVQFPGCCGIVISTEAIVFDRFRRKGLGKLLNTLRCSIAKAMGYGQIVCTEVKTNEPQTKILITNGWQLSSTFTNPKTSHVIQCWHKDL